MKEPPLSICCEAKPIDAASFGVARGDFRDSDRVVTNYMVCSECGEEFHTAGDVGEKSMDTNERITILCAVRYAVGRRSYAPGAVIAYIKERADSIGEQDLDRFIQTIQRSLDWELEVSKALGTTYPEHSRREWLKLINDLEKRYDQD